MNHLLTKSVFAFIIILVGFYLFGEFTDSNAIFKWTRVFFVPSLITLYLTSSYKVNFYFLMFLVLYAAADLCNRFIIISSELNFFLGHSLIILAFLFLVIDLYEALTSNNSLKQIVSENKSHIAVLIVINVFLAYMLLKYIYPYHTLPEMMIPIILYSLEIVLLLSLATLNVFVNTGRTRWLLLTAYVCLILSEIFQLAYIYNTVYQRIFEFLNIVAMLFTFYFLFLHDIKRQKMLKISK